MQNEPIMSFRINKSNGFVLGLIGFDMLKKAIDWGLGRLRAIGKQETSAGKGPARQRAGLESCRYLRQEYLSPPNFHTRESSRRAFGKLALFSLLGKASGEKRYFYETKPTSLLESTVIFAKRCKKPPESEPKNPNRGLYNGFLSVLAGVNREWRATGNVDRRSKARAQAGRPVFSTGQAGMPALPKTRMPITT